MDMVSLWLLFLVMINPVALFLYLNPHIEDMEQWMFPKVIWKATLIAGLIYSIFILTGDFIFLKVFQIDFEAFRLFGWIIIFALAFMFIVDGKESFIKMRNCIDDMAAQLALPFMVGAGSISVSILIWNAYDFFEGALILLVVLLANFLIILALKLIKDSVFHNWLKPYFDKLLWVVFRLNSFFMGAVGVDMILTAITHTF